MRAKLIEKTVYNIECPYCGNQSSFNVSHLIGSGASFGPWYCDGCGCSVTGKASADGSVEIEPFKSSRSKTLDLLCLRPQDKPVYLVVSSINIGDSDGETADSKGYYYEEHTCATNWLGDVEEVIIDGEPDPHGLFEFVASVPDRGEDVSNENVDYWRGLFGHPLK